MASAFANILLWSSIVFSTITFLISIKQLVTIKRKRRERIDPEDIDMRATIAADSTSNADRILERILAASEDEEEDDECDEEDDECVYDEEDDECDEEDDECVYDEEDDEYVEEEEDEYNEEDDEEDSENEQEVLPPQALNEKTIRVAIYGTPEAIAKPNEELVLLNLREDLVVELVDEDGKPLGANNICNFDLNSEDKLIMHRIGYVNDEICARDTTNNRIALV